MSPIEFARQRAVVWFGRYQSSFTDQSREIARSSMLAWHRAAQLERSGALPCDECDGCIDLDQPSCGEYNG